MNRIIIGLIGLMGLMPGARAAINGSASFPPGVPTIDLENVSNHNLAYQQAPAASITGNVTWKNLSLQNEDNSDTDSGGPYNIASSVVQVIGQLAGTSNDQVFSGHLTSLTQNDAGNSSIFANTLASGAVVDALVQLLTGGSTANVTTSQTAALSIDWGGVMTGSSATVTANAITDTITFVNGTSTANDDLEAASCTVLDTSSWASSTQSIGGYITLNGAFAQASVDNILINLDAGSGTTNTTITIGGTSATPSGASAAALADLIANGCTVTTN